MSMRKNVIYNSLSKVDTVVRIVKDFPDIKWLIFTKSIKVAEATHRALTNAGMYHSKMKDAEREANLVDFSNGKTNALVTVVALNEGLNVPDASGAICVTGTSTEISNIQQLGRVVRKQKNKMAIFINLVYEDTIEQSWTKSKNKNLEDTIVLNYEQLWQALVKTKGSNGSFTT